MTHIKTVRKVIALLLALVLSALTVGCAAAPAKVEPKGMVYFNYFDTVSYVYCYINDSAEQFENCSADVAVILEEYHRLFDIYHEYTGINNLCTLNKNAGGEPLEVDEKLIDFLLTARELYEKTGGEMNIMMGAVLALWHDCREAASQGEKGTVPDAAALEEAAGHIDFSLLEIDEENSTVTVTDPDMRLDVGAIAKGYAVEMVAQSMEEKGITGYILNVGGNVRAVGEKSDGEGWTVGVENPADEGEDYIAYLELSRESLVTSGSYQRYYLVNGERYHHIIHPDTLMPAEGYLSVSVLTAHSGKGDALSTALFCMSMEEGKALAESLSDTEVQWVMSDGTIHTTDGWSAYVTEP